ncbi:MAG: hypothetical protein GX445_06675 [Elusimicrobia bacterium]|nr:hypothetical protein [Elusimicrobiota bacterium]
MVKLLLFLFISNLFASDNFEEIYNSSIQSWKNGMVLETIKNLRYIVDKSTDPVLNLKAGQDLVVLLNETAQNSTAVEYLNKIDAIKNNPYLEFERSFSFYSLNRYQASADSFDNLFTITADDDLIFFSRFLRALIEVKMKDYNKAGEELKTVYKSYPPMLPLSSYVMAHIYTGLKKEREAISFLRDSLTYDPRNIEALIELADMYYDTDNYLPAWQSYFTLKEIDTKNSDFSKKAEKLIKRINKDADQIFYWSRLDGLAHTEPLVNRKATIPFRIGLYSDETGKLSSLRSFYFVSNSDFEIYDKNLGRISLNGKKNVRYMLKYTESKNICELIDNLQSKLYSTRSDFEIKLKEKNGIILIKNPSVISGFSGVNKSDKEVSNSLEVFLSTAGMSLINHTYIEHILPAYISAVQGPKDGDEYLKALAIVVRTGLFKKINPEKLFDIPDSDKMFKFNGLEYENTDYISASNLTENELLLSKSSDTYNASYSLNAAGKTYSGVDDGSLKPDKLTPFTLFKWINFDFFKSKPYSMPEDKTRIADIAWALILRPEWIEKRLNSSYKIGRIKNIIVLKRDDFGVVKSIKIDGTAGTVEIDGEEDVRKILSAGTMRSNLFYIRPVMDGSFPDFFIIRGVGTGDFNGMCLYGANYLAKNMGYKYKDILKHYFPDAVIKN